VARLKAAECDLVVMGTIVRETVGAMAEARKTGFEPQYLGSNALYSHLVHVLGGKAVEGLYGVQTVSHPYADDQSKAVRDWAAKYKARFGEDPTVFSVYGYAIMELFAKAADKAGPNLTTDGFINAMETTVFPSDMFGSPEVRVTKTNRLGMNEVRIAQIQNGKWIAISKFIEVRPE
jgi:branched-chain amino acid transport system substrate-binding protein